MQQENLRVWWSRRAKFSVLIFLVVQPSFGATLGGSSLALKSSGVPAGNSWVLDRNGYLGTYVNLTEPGPVTISVTADGAGSPTLGIAIGDKKTNFAVAPGSKTYTASYDLPAGTHFLRTELNNDRGVAGRQLKIDSLAVTGATFSNTNNNANALAAADTYIANYRRGPASIKFAGVAPGQNVSVSLKRIAFDFGAGVHGDGNGVVGQLGSSNSTEQRNYQQYLNQNFNTIATAGGTFWDDNEHVRNVVDMDIVNQVYDYAQAHAMHARLHNLIFEEVQPAWVDSLKAQAVSSGSAKSSLQAAIDSRIGYYIGNPNSQFDQIDVYNESYYQGQLGGPSTYWNLYGPAGIAAVYQNSRLAAGRAGYAPKLYVNDAHALQDPAFGNGYAQNIESLRQAGADAGYGEVVGGIGLQNYESSLRPDLASRFMANLQNFNVQGLPTTLTEFGTFKSVTPTDSATILGQALRLMFGNPTSTGFLVWDWTKEDGGDNQWAPGSTLYTVSTGSWNDFTITPAGKVWQDQLGIHDWDGNPANGWTTQLNLKTAADGTIAFTGFYGDYELSVGGKNYEFTLSKGVSQYQLGNLSTLEGDFNHDGRVDLADYTVWRDGDVRPADYVIWRANFGKSLSGGAAFSQLPEPSALVLASLSIFLSKQRIVRPRGVADVGHQ